MNLIGLGQNAYTSRHSHPYRGRSHISCSFYRSGRRRINGFRDVPLRDLENPIRGGAWTDRCWQQSSEDGIVSWASCSREWWYRFSD